jgi:hypothetical protein
MPDLNMKLFATLDEQTMVNFTGKINVLDQATREMIGVVILKEGEIYRCKYRGVDGLKAFYNIIIESSENVIQDYIVEPEIISDDQKQIHYPYSVLKNKASEIFKRYSEVSHLKPPAHIKLIPKAEFLESKKDVDEAEFQVLCTLAEWSQVRDLYVHCPLLDFEITESLVSLRRKEALTVVGTR